MEAGSARHREVGRPRDAGVGAQAPANGFGATLGATAFHIDDELSPAAAAVFSVHGELDLHVAPGLQGRLASALDDGAQLIVVDLTDVTFIDSVALGVLLAAVQRLRPGGQLRLVVPSPSLRRIFEISLLDHVFMLDATRDEALAAG